MAIYDKPRAATYVGKIARLKGEVALIYVVDGVIKAQFNSFTAKRDGKPLAYGWHDFKLEEFKL